MTHPNKVELALVSKLTTEALVVVKSPWGHGRRYVSMCRKFLMDRGVEW